MFSPRQRRWTEVAPEPTEPEPKSQSRTPPTTIIELSTEFLDVNDLVFGEVLGHGGFGSVYAGQYRGQSVAIKKLHTTAEGVSPSQLEDFRKEVSNLQALKHPRLVAFVGAGYSAFSVCIVTELMSNGSLYNLLHQRQHKLARSEQWNVSLNIAEGVSFLHSRTPPFVHRDLKSLNVVMDTALSAKLCDFGLAQAMEKTHITRRETEAGSPRYMAPELFDSKGKITEKVDVWALGCLSTEVFTNCLPHSDCTTFREVIIKTLLQKELPYKDWADMDVSHEALVRRCFEFNPQQRIDAEIFLARLQALVP